MSGFTSGARRRNDLAALLEGTQITHVTSVAAVNECHAATERINPILDAFRDEKYGHDAVFEWLFQLGRVWPDWVITSPFPVENYRSDKPAIDYPESQRTGEDAAYWEIEYAIRGYVNQIDGVGIIDYDDGGWGFTVTTGHHMLRRVEICDDVAARLQHATTVLTRLLTGFETAA